MKEDDSTAGDRSVPGSTKADRTKKGSAQPEPKSKRLLPTRLGPSSTPDSKRLSVRFKVEGASLVCERHNVFGVWKRVGPRCKVHDICLRGLRFVNTGRRLLPGTKVRLTISFTEVLSIQVQGRTIWCEDCDTEGNIFCGVEFTDFGSNAWAVLCDMYARYKAEGNPA